MKHLGNKMKFEDFKAGVELILSLNPDGVTTVDIGRMLSWMGLSIARGTCLQWLKEMKNDGKIRCTTIRGGALRWHTV